MIFSGRGSGGLLSGQGDRDAEFQALIKAGTTALWDAFLRGDAEARRWLAEGGYEEALGKKATFERKSPASRPVPHPTTLMANEAA